MCLKLHDDDMSEVNLWITISLSIVVCGSEVSDLVQLSLAFQILYCVSLAFLYLVFFEPRSNSGIDYNCMHHTMLALSIGDEYNVRVLAMSIML